MKKLHNKQDGYTEEKAMEYIDMKRPTCILRTNPDKKIRYVDGEATGDIEFLEYTFIQQGGEESFSVKFPFGEFPELKWNDQVEIMGLKAIEVTTFKPYKRTDVYFRATAFKKVGDK